MVLAGGVMMATGVGGPIGLALIGAGADTIIQKATTGEVNWGQVALSGAFGLVLGVGVAGNVLAHVGANAAEGAVQNIAQYAISGRPLTPGGFVETAASGAALSAVTAEALKKLSTPSAVSKLEDLAPEVRYGPLNPGRLSEQVADSFRSSSCTVLRLTEDTTLYRVYGGQAGPVGGYRTRVAPAGPLQVQIDGAINPAWGNEATNIGTTRVPAGTTAYEGIAASQHIAGGGHLHGGRNQVLFPHVDSGWVIP